MATNANEIQVKFVTKHQQYVVPEIPITIPANIDVPWLNKLINKLLKDNNNDYSTPIDFDFLINDRLLREPLYEHIKDRDLSTDVTIEIEYLQRIPTPQPENALLHKDWISGIHVADKWVLTGCYDTTINICNINGEHELSLASHEREVKSVCWIKDDDPSHGFVSVSEDVTGILWNWQPGSSPPKKVAILKGHERGIETVRASPDATRIATGGWDKNLKIWSTNCENNNSRDDDVEDDPPNKKNKKHKSNVKTQTPLHTLSGHQNSISRLVWTDNNTICTASMDHTIKFWDAQLYGIKHEIVGQKAYLGVSWSPLANAVLASSADRHIRLYDPRSSEGSVCKTVFTSHKGWVPCVSWSMYDSNLFMSGGYDSMVKLWDTRSPNAPLYDLTGHEKEVLCVDWTNRKYLISGGMDNRVHIYKNSHLS